MSTEFGPKIIGELKSECHEYVYAVFHFSMWTLFDLGQNDPLFHWALFDVTGRDERWTDGDYAER